MIHLNFGNRSVGLSEGKANNEGVVLFPNPSNGRVALKVDEALGELKSLALINSLGQQVWSKSAWPKLVEFDWSDLEKGIHILQIEAAAGFFTKQLVLK